MLDRLRFLYSFHKNISILPDSSSLRSLLGSNDTKQKQRRALKTHLSFYRMKTERFPMEERGTNFIADLAECSSSFGRNARAPVRRQKALRLLHNDRSTPPRIKVSAEFRKPPTSTKSIVSFCRLARNNSVEKYNDFLKC
jgi:hypothetical protein